MNTNKRMLSDLFPLRSKPAENAGVSTKIKLGFGVFENVFF
jgi:hypothetical protein